MQCEFCKKQVDSKPQIEQGKCNICGKNLQQQQQQSNQ